MSAEYLTFPSSFTYFSKKMPQPEYMPQFMFNCLQLFFFCLFEKGRIYIEGIYPAPGKNAEASTQPESSQSLLCIEISKSQASRTSRNRTGRASPHAFIASPKSFLIPFLAATGFLKKLLNDLLNRQFNVTFLSHNGINPSVASTTSSARFLFSGCS